MSFDEPFEDDRRVPFAGDHGGIALVFDPETLPTWTNSEEFPNAVVAIRTAGVQAASRVGFTAPALVTFALELERAHRALSGTAELQSEGIGFDLRVIYGSRGHIALVGHLQPVYDAKTILNFEIETDQSYISASLFALNEVLRTPPYRLEWRS